MIALWCDTCKWSQKNPPDEIVVKIVEGSTIRDISPVEVEVGKNLIEQWKKEGKNPNEEIENIKRERKSLLTRMYNELKNMYPMVIWCTKRKTLVCCNPKKPTTYVDMSTNCKDFELKG